MSDRRRAYMSDHLERRIANVPRRREERRAKQEEGSRLRELVLNAPKSEAELLSLPTIEASLLDEYPIRDTDKEARLQARRANRLEHEAIRREDKLHSFLEIHHRAGRYATDLEALDKMLHAAFQPILSYNAAPTHTLRTLVEDANGARARDFAQRMRDAEQGTAAGGQPGVVEVGAILEGGDSKV